MKTYLSVLLAALMVGVPSAAFATSFSSGEELSLGVSQRVSDDWYVAAGTAVIGGTVAGDLVATGGTVTLTGAVQDGAFIAGGTVQLLGPVAGDVRAAGGSLTIGGAVGGDVVVTGGTVRILSDARISGGLYAVGGTVIMDGLVAGEARVTAGTLIVNGSIGGTLTARIRDSLTIASGGTVGGDVVYTAPHELELASDGTIAGEVTYTPRGNGINRSHTQGAARAVAWTVAAALTALETIVMLGAAALLVWRWRRDGTELLQDAYSPLWKNAGVGLLYLVVVPLAALFLAALVIGIIPALLLMLAYAGLGIVARVLAAVMLGAIVERMLRKSSALHISWLNALGGVLLFQLIGLLPVVGWLVRALLFLTVFGVLAQRVRRALV
jgi:cytoskeletal protein CcmA (bactofilin family)